LPFLIRSASNQCSLTSQPLLLSRKEIEEELLLNGAPLSDVRPPLEQHSATKIDPNTTSSWEQGLFGGTQNQHLGSLTSMDSFQNNPFVKNTPSFDPSANAQLSRQHFLNPQTVASIETGTYIRPPSPAMSDASSIITTAAAASPLWGTGGRDSGFTPSASDYGYTPPSMMNPQTVYYTPPSIASPSVYHTPASMATLSVYSTPAPSAAPTPMAYLAEYDDVSSMGSPIVLS